MSDQPILKINALLIATTAAMTFSSVTSAASNNTKTKYGITVTTCGYDYDEENFCDNARMQTFAKVMQSRPANFNKDMLLYIYTVKGHNNPLRVVVMDKKNKTVTPLYWELRDADQAVNAKGDRKEITFTKASNEFCFKGDIMAYRNAYTYDREYNPEFCYDYDRKEKDFGWFKTD